MIWFKGVECGELGWSGCGCGCGGVSRVGLRVGRLVWFGVSGGVWYIKSTRRVR